MPGTVYSFHAAEDHSILDTATPETMQAKAANIAARIHRGLPYPDKATRVYCHNGRGIVAVGLCRQGLWNDLLRDDWQQFDAVAREKRAAAHLPND